MFQGLAANEEAKILKLVNNLLQKLNKNNAVRVVPDKVTMDLSAGYDKSNSAFHRIVIF